MDCESIHQHLSALVDNELQDELRVDVERHLESCSNCQAALDQLREVNAVLLDQLRIRHPHTTALAARATARLAENPNGALPSDSTTRGGGHHRRYGELLVALLAGFLLAVLVRRPDSQSHPQPVTEPSTVESNKEQENDVPPTTASAADTALAMSSVARVVHLTGPLAFQRNAAADWQSITPSEIPNFSCPREGCVRTEPGALCELETEAGDSIRLNEGTEVMFRSSEEIELRRGQVWCRVSEHGRLRILPVKNTRQSQAAPDGPTRALLDPYVINCATSSQCLTTHPPGGQLQVMPAARGVEIALNGVQHELAPGQTYTLSNGELSPHQSTEDWLISSRWMQPLLVLNGHNNIELQQRVAELLFQIGRTKVALMYEDDLRSLGEFGALPLLRYVQNEKSRQEPVHRHTAVRILVDTAAVWMVPELIELTSDSDAFVRSSAGRALARLTGQDSDLASTNWQADGSRWTSAVDSWRRWWNVNQFSCHQPPEVRGPSAQVPPPLLKARN